MPRQPVLGYSFWGVEIPEYMAPPLEAWIDEGRVPGDFLQALLSNDLRATIERADASNLTALRAYLGYLYNQAPQGCYGSPANVKAWAKRGGLQGRGSPA